MRIATFLQQSPIFQIGRISRHLDTLLGHALSREEVTPFEALVLAAIFFERRGDARPSALAETFETTRGNVSHTVSSLEARGLVERRIDPDDARAVRLLLTPAGRRRAVRVAALLDGIQRSLEAALTPAGIASMLKTMDAVDEHCAGITQSPTR